MPRLTHLNYEEVRKDIETIGFTKTMKKYNIKYLVASQNLDYKKYFEFSNEDDPETAEKRTRNELILEKFEEKDDEQTNDRAFKKNYQVKEMMAFKLDSIYGDYRIYKLWED
jgi:hypothetical protein